MWKLRDIVLMVILAIICGLIYEVWGLLYNVLNFSSAAGQAAMNGVWYIAGILVPIIIRRPGAALLGEVLASIVEMATGSSWGLANVLAGVLQGIGAEIIFAIFRYRVYNMTLAMLAGMLSFVLDLPQWFLEYSGGGFGPVNQTIYIVVSLISGAILGGWLSQVMASALNRTGVLRNFEIGRQARAAK